MAKCST